MVSGGWIYSCFKIRRMTKSIFIAQLISVRTLAIAQYKAVAAVSMIQFKIRNFGINTGDSSTRLQENARFAINHLNQVCFDVSKPGRTANF